MATGRSQNFSGQSGWRTKLSGRERSAWGAVLQRRFLVCLSTPPSVSSLPLDLDKDNAFWPCCTPPASWVQPNHLASPVSTASLKAPNDQPKDLFNFLALHLFCCTKTKILQKVNIVGINCTLLLQTLDSGVPEFFPRSVSRYTVARKPVDAV